MPELTDEHIEDLFADLRAREIQQVRPPGVAAAQTTVRRRRTVASVAAGLAVVAVAGTAAVTLTDLGKPRTAVQTVAARPPLSSAVLAHRRDLAAEAIGLVGPDQGLSTKLMVTEAYTDTNPVFAGTYLLKMSCAGTGTVNILVYAGPLDGEGSFHRDAAPLIQGASVPCTETASMQTVAFAVPPAVNGFLGVAIQPDAAAKGQSGFAYKAEPSVDDQKRMLNAAQAGLPARNGAHWSGSGLLDPSVNVQDDTIAAGTYRLDIACAGIGSASMTIWDRHDRTKADLLIRLTVACTSGSKAATTTFTKKGGAGLMFSLQADDVGFGRAAGAYQVSAV